MKRRPQLGGVLCLLDQYSKVLPLELILHQLQVTGNDSKQVIEVMRDAARQLADRFQISSAPAQADAALSLSASSTCLRSLSS